MKKIAFLTATVLFISACSKSTPKTELVQDDNLVTVKTTPVLRETVSTPILASGMITSESESKPAFKTGGVIDRILVKEGDFVRAGQLLATLNLTEINAQVQQAKDALSKAERDVKRVENLFKDSVATKEQLENARTGLSVSQQTVSIAEFNKSFSEIHASMSGKVVKLIMHEGEIAGPGMPVFYILGTSQADWLIKVGLADRDWARLRVGDLAKVSLDAYPGESFTATIKQLADVANPMSGTFDAELSIQSNGKKLAAGLVAAVELFPQVQGAKAIIPIEALTEANGKQGYVFAVDGNGIARRFPVTIAFLAGKNVAIATGLEQVNAVVSVGAEYLSDGQKVKL